MRTAVFAALAGAACIAATACTSTQESARARSSPSAVAAVTAPIATPAPAEPDPIARVDEAREPFASAGSTAVSEGVTEAQPDAKTRAPQLLAAASAQIDRLNRVERSDEANDRAPRVAVDSALVDLVAKSERVTQDLRDLELDPVSRGADISMQLETDVADLEQSLQNSYAAAPAH